MTAPAGWYDDGSGRQRWWDGGQWTDHFAEVDSAGIITATSDTRPPRASKRLWIVIAAVIGGLLLATASAVAAVVVIANSVNSGPADAVMAYNEAWDEDECALLQSVTTPEFLEDVADSCTTFHERVQDFRQRTPGDYSVEVTGVEVNEQFASVNTVESYIEDGVAKRIDCVYRLERSGDRWLVSSLSYTE